MKKKTFLTRLDFKKRLNIALKEEKVIFMMSNDFKSCKTEWILSDLYNTEIKIRIEYECL